MIQHPTMGAIYHHALYGAWEVAVIPLTFGRARIVIARVGSCGPEDGW